MQNAKCKMKKRVRNSNISVLFLFGVFMRGNKPPVLLGVKKGFSKDKTGVQMNAEKMLRKY